MTLNRTLQSLFSVLVTAQGPSESEADQRREMKRKLGSSTHGVSRSTCASLRGRDQQLRASQLSWDKVGRGQLGRWHKEQSSAGSGLWLPRSSHPLIGASSVGTMRLPGPDRTSEVIQSRAFQLGSGLLSGSRAMGARGD